MNRIGEDAFYRERQSESENEQATDEETLDNACLHIIRAEERLNILFRAVDLFQEDGGKAITLDGPLFDLIKEAHNNITKAYNTVRYLQETE